MLKYILLRLLAMIPLLFVVLFIVFSLGHLAPGDPVEMMYVNVVLEQSTVTEEQKQEVRHRYGLDQPFFVQFGTYVQRLAQGEAREMLFDLTEAPAVTGPKTQEALGQMLATWEQAGKPIALLSGPLSIQQLQLRRLVATYAPRHGALFTSLDEARAWLDAGAQR